ncbi:MULTISPECIES: DUF4262 domain-containing protein [Mycolicibacterium]|uniref:DUF4262 domain-containing protein n=1 Tax=Mycolicibacterium senegalense TaxID=1796 RepID=A0A378SYW0_9MYCO|nr:MULTISPECIES: DUF4262 domain-containing protein [Mycolicibacterium]MCV7336804.1 DUF4262 domain-containing protein [Mycolicibacterium senegalense]MDR7291694.1 hypothetical protein [Mycolicibacterium senegalense]QZA23152.1 DUF4262 domain-containing protein [Mycolicibacterium senegalense]CDP89915.1 hypothetical protein BN975_05778 [Mycolicibacterium farcinogenes]STZ53304.1 Uncharacterised protein [Mycolicibacterium senegalense]
MSDAQQERDSRIAADVTEYGWHVVGVGGNDETPADWAYSIGLGHTLGSPEICLFGLRIETMMTIVNVAGQAVRDGNPMEPAQLRDDILNDYPVAIRPVHPSWFQDFFGAGIDFYRTRELAVLQLFWPDAEGRFPWDDQVHEYCRSSQPLLWIPKEQAEGPWAELDRPNP